MNVYISRRNPRAHPHTHTHTHSPLSFAAGVHAQRPTPRCKTHAHTPPPPHTVHPPTHTVTNTHAHACTLPILQEVRTLNVYISKQNAQAEAQEVAAAAALLASTPTCVLSPEDLALLRVPVPVHPAPRFEIPSVLLLQYLHGSLMLCFLKKAVSVFV